MKRLMKIGILIVTVSLVLLLVPYTTVFCEGQIEYAIHVDYDGSATWVITRVAELNASIDNLEQFQNRVMSLVEAAKNRTGREMTADVESIKHILSGSYVVVEYRFNWENFSKTENAMILIGDVFQVETFFARLYGDGEVQIAYPSGYVVETVLPEPYERDDSQQTIRWLGTIDFTNGLPILILKEPSVTPGSIDNLRQSAIMILSLAAIVSGSSVSFYILRHHRKKKRETMEVVEHPVPPGIESDEERIVKLLKASGGGLYQSVIVDQCKFSKAKVSQLLAAMESKGVVSRYKKGRAKIVSLVQKDEGEEK